MQWWLALVVSTAIPVTMEQLEAVQDWEAKSSQLLYGPEACVELAGQVDLKLAVYTPGGWLGPGGRQDYDSHGTFSGKLDHGVWRDLQADMPDDDGENGLNMDDVHPMVGRKAPAAEEGAAEGGSVSVGVGKKGANVDIAHGSAQALNLLDEIIAGIDPAVTTAYALWDASREAVLLRRFLPLDDSRTPDEVEVRTWFPGGGYAMAVDVIFPRRVQFKGGMVNLTLLNAQMHLRGQETALGVLPGVESLSLVLGALGFTVGMEQRLTYTRARACGG